MATKDDITRESTVRKAVDEGQDTASQGADAVRTPASETDTRASSAEDACLCSADGILAQLIYHIDELQFANGALSICVQALRQQNADMDADIALLLDRTVGDVLFEAAERIEQMKLTLEYGGEMDHCEGGETAAA